MSVTVGGAPGESSESEGVRVGCPLLEMRGIEKSFPGVRALRGAELELRAGEVLALVGENGAGKSTLIKVLSGAHLPDAGEIRIAGRDPGIDSPSAALLAGVAVIYQEFNLVPGLTARENIFLGSERARFGFLSPADERAAAKRLFGRVGVPVDPETACRRLTVAEQQIVEIAKALALEARIIVMDEPSATLTTQEVESLFRVIRELRSQGIGTVYVSHRLDEIFEIADRVTVMRDGEHIATRPIAEITRDELIEMMVGRRIEDEFPERTPDRGDVRLRVSGLTRGSAVRDVSFTARRGEVLGLTGLVGSGRTEVARLLFGADRRDAGEVELDGRALRLRSPREAIREGVSLLTEDRKSQGLILSQTIRENFGLPNLKSFSRMGFVDQRRERACLGRWIDSLRIKVPGSETPAGALSGGNQQKVVLAKWLEANAEVIVFDEPTRGIDVGAKYEIYQLIGKLADDGKVVILISSELPEVLGVCDRILVMHEGRLTGEIEDPRSASQEDVLRLAVKQERS